MAIFAGASAGAVVRLRCPTCGATQVRARAPEKTTYRCKECGALFQREDVELRARRK